MENVSVRTREALPPGTRRVWAFAVAIVALATAALLVRPLTLPEFGMTRLPWWSLAIMFFLCEIFVVHVQFRRDAHSFSLSEVVLVLGLFTVSPIGLVAAQLIGAGLALGVHRRQAAVKLIFNLANFSLGTTLAIDIFSILADPATGIGVRDWVAAFAATLVAGVMGALLIVGAISLSENQLQSSLLPQSLGFGVIVSMTNTGLGLIAVSVVAQNPAATALVAIPAATLFFGYRAYTMMRDKHESLEFLYESTRVITRSPDTDTAVRALLEHARKMFRCEYAELRIFSDDDTDLRTSVGPGEEISAMQSVPHASTGPLGAGGRRAVLLTGLADDVAAPAQFPALQPREAMVAPLTGETRVFGVISVVNRLGDVSTFGAQDLTLFETLANHASVALENGRLEKSLQHVTQLKEELHYRAFHDPLTGLANRTLFAERVEHALVRGARDASHLAVLFVDLDDFKTVNDSLGHASGDALLIEVARRLERCLRPSDTASRLGGDEFAVLLEEVPGEEVVIATAQRLIDALRTPFTILGQEVFVHASVGIAIGVAGVDNVEELLRNADVAMYTAKGAGKGRFEVFRRGMHVAAMHRLEITASLARAVDREEFVALYQPTIQLGTGTIVGAEALLRWPHPTRGLVSPDEFIPVAEDTGVILPLGTWVLNEACQQAAAWSKIADGPFCVAVNLSARQFQQPDIVSIVRDALIRSGIEPSSLTLEITESILMHDVDATLERLHELKSLGIRLAIDDFGTGYSSLAYLRRFPVDAIKIDRSFISGVDADPQDAALVQAIVQLAKTLGLDVIAEGIERPGHRHRLLQLGCPLGQGFLFDRPMNASSMRERLRRQSAEPSRVIDLQALA